jgi:hypothetical protein
LFEAQNDVFEANTQLLWPFEAAYAFEAAVFDNRFDPLLLLQKAVLLANTQLLCAFDKAYVELASLCVK